MADCYKNSIKDRRKPANGLGQGLGGSPCQLYPREAGSSPSCDEIRRGRIVLLIAQSASLVANPTSWASAVRRTNVQLGQRIIAGPRIN